MMPEIASKDANVAGFSGGIPRNNAGLRVLESAAAPQSFHGI
jgi:hypothetical protein